MTSTEQPEALRLARWLKHRSMSGVQPNDLAASTELRRLHARISELEAERDEADRRAGRAERHMAGLNDDVRRFDAARRRMKVQWGVHENVSFDDVWQQALDAKASQAQRVPLSDAEIGDFWEGATGGHSFNDETRRDFVRSIEQAHGITQEKRHGE